MDMATFYRSGARFGPRAIREASGQLRPHHWDPAKLEPPYDKLRIIDYGDLDVYPGYVEQSVEHLQKEIAPIFEAGVFPGRPRRGPLDHTAGVPRLRREARQAFARALRRASGLLGAGGAPERPSITAPRFASPSRKASSIPPLPCRSASAVLFPRT